jgi:transcriptional regulator with XRE-family HTH domain
MEPERSIFRERRDSGEIEKLWYRYVGDDDARELCEARVRREFKRHILLELTAGQCRFLQEQRRSAKHEVLAKILGVDRTMVGRYLNGSHAMPLARLQELHDKLKNEGLSYPADLPRRAAVPTISFLLKTSLRGSYDTLRGIRVDTLPDYTIRDYWYTCDLLRRADWALAFNEMDVVAFQRIGHEIIHGTEVSPDPDRERPGVETCWQLCHIWDVWRVPFLLTLDTIQEAPQLVTSLTR